MGRSTRKPRLLSLAAALGANVLLLAGLVFTLKAHGPPAEPRPVVVSLAPQVVTTPRRQRIRQAAAAATATSEAAPRPVTPSPLAASPAPSTQAGPDLGRVRSILRGSVGCSDAELLKLTDAERENCRRWLEARIDPERRIAAPIDPMKRAWFDAALATHSAPARLPAFGCGLLIDGLRLKAPKAPPHAFKLGPLPCIATLPRGPLTQEVDLEPPSRDHPIVAANSARPPPGVVPMIAIGGGASPGYQGITGGQAALAPGH